MDSSVERGIDSMASGTGQGAQAEVRRGERGGGAEGTLQGAHERRLPEFRREGAEEAPAPKTATYTRSL